MFDAFVSSVFYIFFLYLYIYFHSFPLSAVIYLSARRYFVPSFRRITGQTNTKSARTAIVFYMPRSVFALHRESLLSN